MLPTPGAPRIALSASLRLLSGLSVAEAARKDVEPCGDGCDSGDGGCGLRRA